MGKDEKYLAAEFIPLMVVVECFDSVFALKALQTIADCTTTVVVFLLNLQGRTCFRNFPVALHDG